MVSSGPGKRAVAMGWLPSNIINIQMYCFIDKSHFYNTGDRENIEYRKLLNNSNLHLS